MPDPISSSDDDNAPLLAKQRSGDNSQPLSITAISNLLKRTVEDQFGHVKLRGELSGVKRAASGHLYCSLKDEGAVIDAVMWRGSAARLSFQPEDGIEVIATGKLTTYPGRSKYQIVMERMEIAGEGALLALLEKTRARLAAEGLFAAERKRRLPFAPRVIGVVTSPTGAVIRDILHRLHDRFPTHVLLWPVLVQGQGAAEQVAEAVRGFGAMAADGKVPRPDLLIVGRGGGAIEDLWAFNEEVVVRAIADSPIPVISAVGHETDTTLADFAADIRAPTPTAAAEMAVPVKREIAAMIDDLAHRQKRASMRPVTLGRERLAARAERLPRPEQILQAKTQKLDELSERLRRGLFDQVTKGRERLARQRLSPVTLQRALRDAQGRLAGVRLAPALVTRRIAEQRQALDGLARLTEQLHPKRPLQRGYAIVRGASGKLLTSAALARKEASLGIEFADGTLDAAPGSAPSDARAAPKRKAAPKSPESAQPKLL